MLTDMSQWKAFNAVYGTYFEKNFPARASFGVTGLALGARVEIDCIAVVDNR
jgi:enamine deaminase RidA (YjgF/YER057c/UK114 family)